MIAPDMLSGDHRDVLDVIDTLRSQGFSHYVQLPQIIVCGDQSAGKSSVLEAISGKKFPTKDGLCTRFATELMLRRGPERSTRISITPGADRFDKERNDLEGWQPKINVDPDDLEAITQEAMELMAHPTPRRFYDDILRIELTGPDQPHLTMVDLPGLFRVGNREQSGADGKAVQEMVQRYMASPRSIILAVVSAKNEYVLQEVTSMARAADPEGLRTIGLITKPDTLDVGSESEKKWVTLAQNQDVALRLGWHVLRNRNYDERKSTLAQRDAVEKKFFSNGIWSSMNPLHCGVTALRNRLSSALKDQIVQQTGSLVHDVEQGVSDCKDKLERLGPVRANQDQQSRYLTRVSEEYTSLMTQAIEGTYTNSFFGNPRHRDMYPRRLRAVVQNRLLEFSQEMRFSGQSLFICDTEDEAEEDSQLIESPRISRSEYAQGVTQRLKFGKGRELPGLFNPLIIGDLFVDQCEPWQGITSKLVDDLTDAAQYTAQMLLSHIVASDVADQVLKFVHDGIEKLRIQLGQKICELLASATQHPITYNRQLTEDVGRIQEQRFRRALKKVIGDTFRDDLQEAQNKIRFNPVHFIDSLAVNLMPDLENFGSLTAVDYMEAYYKVAMSRFIDDVSVHGIEDCLVSELPKLFRPRDVADMDPEDICRLARESSESSLERTRLVQKLEILDAGLPVLKSFQKRRGAYTSPIQHGGTVLENARTAPLKSEPSTEEQWTMPSDKDTSPSVVPRVEEEVAYYVEGNDEDKEETGHESAGTEEAELEDKSEDRLDWPRRPRSPFN